MTPQSVSLATPSMGEVEFMPRLSLAPMFKGSLGLRRQAAR
jgi:hypothetical protein